MKTLLLLIVLMAVGGFAYFYWNGYRPAEIVFDENPATSTPLVVTEDDVVYENESYGFTITYPKTMTATSSFASTYLLPKNWRLNQEGRGEQVIAIVYPDSNEVLSGAVRIGASRDSAAIADCLKPEAQGATSTVELGGTPFLMFEQSDAAMSHFAKTRSYRAVLHQACIAIDRVIYGTNPEVYDPPRSVPFAEEVARTALDQMITTFTPTSVLGVFKGTLPCADCTGIETELTLVVDNWNTIAGTYTLRETYKGKSEEAILSTGNWKSKRGTDKNVNATVYQLDFDDPLKKREYVRLNETTLRLLDREGKEIVSDLPYNLTK